MTSAARRPLQTQTNGPPAPFLTNFAGTAGARSNVAAVISTRPAMPDLTKGLASLSSTRSSQVFLALSTSEQTNETAPAIRSSG